MRVPSIEIKGQWRTALNHSAHDDKTIMPLYPNHGICEQFHSEFKTGLDIQRQPSGKSATNDLIMNLAALSYYSLRWIGLIVSGSRLNRTRSWVLVRAQNCIAILTANNSSELLPALTRKECTVATNQKFLSLSVNQ